MPNSSCNSRIQNVHQKIFMLVCAFFSFANPRKWGVISEIYSATRFDAAVTISYSQCAEDISLLHFLSGQKNGFYIDVGAHDPNRFSVTRLLYYRGWKGINIDANPDIERKFKKFRPNDQFINCAVGNKDSYEFFQFEESAISTVNNEWKEKFLSENNKIVNTLNVPGLSLRRIIDSSSRKSIDLLNIDVEGADFEVIRSAEFETLPKSNFPKWISVETPIGVNNVINLEMIRYLQGFNYEIMSVLPMSTILKLN